VTDKNSVGFYSVQVKIEACYDLLIAADDAAEAMSEAFHAELPVKGVEDFKRDVVRIVQMNKRVYVS